MSGKVTQKKTNIKKEKKVIGSKSPTNKAVKKP
jgi:hypothetical protein